MNKKYLECVKSLYGDTITVYPPKGTTTKRSCNLDKRRRQKRHIEAGLQIQLVSWALEQGFSLLAIPNEGQRSKLQGYRAKQMGLRPGAADLFLAHCAKGYGGYWIELKCPGERPRDNQIAFLDEMQQRGYKAGWFDNLDNAKNSIKDYLDD